MRHKNLLYAALSDIIRRRIRSIVVTLCLATILFPLVTALAISEGLRFQAEMAVTEGADLYITRELYGGEGPISPACSAKLSELEGISRVTARVIGRTYFVDRLVAIVGLDRDGLLAEAHCPGRRSQGPRRGCCRPGDCKGVWYKTWPRHAIYRGSE